MNKLNLSSKFLDLVDFMKFLHEFRAIERKARVPNSKRNENDAEHSYQLAMVAWFLIDQNNLNLNKELCFMYALSHDLVETYAGDTPIFDKTATLTKEKREKEAFILMEKRFSNFNSLLKFIHKYEKKEDEESKFIYALDKLIDPVQIFMEDGKLWHDHNLSFEEIVGYKSEKILLSSDVNKYWQELLAEITLNKEKFFPR